MEKRNDIKTTIEQLVALEERLAQLREEISNATQLRAQQLVQNDDITLIVAMLRNQFFGIPISFVNEVIQMVKVTPLPNSSPLVAGIVNYRGKIIPVINLDKIFGLETRVIRPTMAIIVIQNEDSTIGVIIDSVEDVHTYTRTDIELTTELKQLPSNIVGTIKTSENPIFIIDVANLFEIMDFESLSSNINRNVLALNSDSNE